jgi:hypothetical protein
MTGFQGDTPRFMFSTGEEMSFTVMRVFVPSKAETEIVQPSTSEGIRNFNAHLKGFCSLLLRPGPKV